MSANNYTDRMRDHDHTHDHSTAPLLINRLRKKDLIECRPARHDYYALVFYTGGAARMRMPTEMHCSPGDVMLVPAGMVHELRESSADVALHGVGFYRDPKISADLFAPFERVRAGAMPIEQVPLARRPFIEFILNELTRESRADLPRSQASIQHLLALLLLETGRIFEPGADRRFDPGPAGLVGRALRFIEEHHLRPITLADVADAVGRSPSHLTTAVRQATGRPVLAWILAGRMREARSRLRYTDQRIEDIAEHVGYADATHFTRLFRREHGITPAAWRRKNRPQ